MHAVDYHALAARGESPASHRGRRCARTFHPTAHSPRRGDPGGAARRAQSGVPTVRLVHGGVQYREYLNEEQRSQPRGPQRGSRVGVEEGCSAGRMQLEFHHGLLEVTLPRVGVVLTPIVAKETVALEDLRGRSLAVDGNGELYQFLALIRLRDGTPLRDSKGRITSHLAGLFYRTTRLIADYGLDLVFVFDGTPPALKADEIQRRRSTRAPVATERCATRRR